MNTQGIKESFSRIQAWIKANPKKSIAIAILLVVVFYFAIKRGMSNTGEGIGQEAAGESSAEAMGGGLGDIGGAFGSGASIGGSSGGSSGGSTGGSSGGGFETMFDNGGGFTDSFMPSFGFGSGSTSSIINDPFAAVAANKGSDTVKNAAPAATAAAATNKNNNVVASANKAPVNPTPAMAFGKGRNYTGYINGVYYVLGYPAYTGSGSSAISGSVSSGSGTAAIKQVTGSYGGI